MAAQFAGWRREGRLAGHDLVVPVWTMGVIGREQVLAVAGGTGIAGCHGGMCDAFRANVDGQFLTGAQWVAHSGNDGVRYGVRVVSDHAVVVGCPDFELETAQCHLHVDPAVKVHAVCDVPVAEGPHVVNGPVAMPVVFTEGWGKGRVLYNALGHKAGVIGTGGAAEMTRRGPFRAMRR